MLIARFWVLRFRLLPTGILLHLVSYLSDFRQSLHFWRLFFINSDLYIDPATQSSSVIWWVTVDQQLSRNQPLVFIWTRLTSARRSLCCLHSFVWYHLSSILLTCFVPFIFPSSFFYPVIHHSFVLSTIIWRFSSQWNKSFLCCKVPHW